MLISLLNLWADHYENICQIRKDLIFIFKVVYLCFPQIEHMICNLKQKQMNIPMFNVVQGSLKKKALSCYEGTGLPFFMFLQKKNTFPYDYNILYRYSSIQWMGK